MEFIETPMFTALIADLLDDDEYSKLQKALVRNVEAGDLIPGGGGMRKLRWAHPHRNKGKRGGIRVIYYAYIEGFVFMLLAYDKDRNNDLTRKEMERLRQYVKGGIS